LQVGPIFSTGVIFTGELGITGSSSSLIGSSIVFLKGTLNFYKSLGDLLTALDNLTVIGDFVGLVLSLVVLCFLGDLRTWLSNLFKLGFVLLGEFFTGLFQPYGFPLSSFYSVKSECGEGCVHTAPSMKMAFNQRLR
jgi:hypothetical protein